MTVKFIRIDGFTKDKAKSFLTSLLTQALRKKKKSFQLTPFIFPLT